MIERLTLHRWRAFDTVEINFGPGTTFLVAPNGVGKTSLLLGMAWAIFGEKSKVNARECIRAGAGSTEAIVMLVIPDRGTMVIARSISEKGKESVSYQIDGSDVPRDEAEGLLEDAFGVRLEIAARLSMMLGGGHVASEKALDLQDHLYDAFGVSGLKTAAVQAEALAKNAAKERASIRSVARQRLTDRADKETQLEDLESKLRTVLQTRADLQSELEKANAAELARSSWNDYEAKIAARQRDFETLVEAARQFDLQGDSPEDLLASLERMTSQARAELATIADHITEARARSHSAERALSLLDGDQPGCPTCLRPFHGEDLAEAIAAQNVEFEEAQTQEANWKERKAVQEANLEQLDELRVQLRALPSEPIRPTSNLPVEDPASLREQALVALQEHDTSIGRLQQERDVILRDLEADDELIRIESAQHSAYRREAVAKAAAIALAKAAEQLTRAYVEPLADAVRWRWKGLFGEEGLQLRPDGSIVRVVGDRELSWETLSGGERIWARLVTHLLVLGTSTQLPFAWFDEPLEHLDPRTRRSVAAALATATQHGEPSQLIVTTYEHPVARQLAADVENAYICYLRREPTNEPPLTAPRRVGRSDASSRDDRAKRAAG